MFRWLALCLVLCAGAFALVAMATGAFNARAAARRRTRLPVRRAPSDVPNDAVQAARRRGLGHGGAVSIKDARLTAIEREEVPSQHDGTMLVVGTDDPADPDEPAEMLPSDPRALPGAHDRCQGPERFRRSQARLPPESEWLFLIKAPDSRFREASARARLGNLWDQLQEEPECPDLSPLARGRPALPRQGRSGV